MTLNAIFAHCSVVCNRATFYFSDYRQLETHRIVSLRMLDIQAFTLFFHSFTFYCVTLFQDGTYQNNKVNIPTDFKFAFVDDVKIFEFISTLGKGAIKDFDKVEDIEHYFAHQISGMLYDYLVGLQDNHEKERIKTAVDEIKVVSQSMKDMINSIAEKILGKDQGKYKDLIRKQNESLIDFFMELVDQNISIKKNGHLFKDQEIEDCAKGICEIFYSTIFNTESISKIDDSNNLAERYKSLEELQQKCAYLVKQNYSDIDFNIYLFRLRKPMIQIFDMVGSDEQLKDYFEESLYVIINTNLSLPF